MRPLGRLNMDIRFISSSASVNSTTLKLSAMRCGFEERGMAAIRNRYFLGQFMGAEI